MPTYEDNIEYTQPTQPIEEFTQAVDEEQENGNDENIIGTLVRINGNLVQDYNLYLEKIVVIGRHRTCNIVVDSSYSSNKHCRVKVTKSPGTEDFVVVCEDLSSNGTLWNGKKIGKNNKVILTHGDTLEIKKGNYITFLLKSKYLKKKSEQDKQLDISSMYQITDTELGSGTFAKVKLAIRKDTQEQVAVKIMDKANNRNPGSIGGGTNYIDEVNLLRAFDHPNIVRVFDVLETEKQVYIFMPLLRGGDLFDYILNNVSLTEEETKFITYQILLALKYLHERNVSHRDLKPENILMLSKDQPYSIVMLSDFGMARVIGGQGARMQTICGTFQYIAPEVIRTGMDAESIRNGNTSNGAGRGYSKAVDCWSLGVIVYAMLSGMLPFSSSEGDDNTLFAQILSGNVDYSLDAFSSVSDKAISFISRLLQVNPLKRMTVHEAFEDPWMKPVLKDLAQLYQHRLKKLCSPPSLKAESKKRPIEVASSSLEGKNVFFESHQMSPPLIKTKKLRQ